MARLEAASATRPLEFLDDLAWALLYLGNERHRLGDLEGAVEADERAVARVRTEEFDSAHQRCLGVLG